MLQNCTFLNASDRSLSKYLEFSVTPKKCYFDVDSASLICYDRKRLRVNYDRSRCSFANVDLDTLTYEEFDTFSLRKSYEIASKMFSKKMASVDLFDKKQKADRISYIRDILSQSQERRKKECDDLLAKIDYFEYDTCDDKDLFWRSRAGAICSDRRVSSFNCDIDEYIQKREKSREDSYNAKKKRIGRKALMNRSKWKFFVTITRDDACFSDEVTWEKSLRRYLQNLDDRYGFRFIGVFERGKKSNRLHFHALCYLPEAEDGFSKFLKKGFTFEKRKSDRKSGKIVSVLESVDIREKYGMNDWEALDSSSDDDLLSCIRYVTKYITKTTVGTFYSRHLPTEVLRYVSFDDVYFTGFDGVYKYFICNVDVLSREKLQPLSRDIPILDTSPPLPFAL